jgi:hypothetical protein
VSAPKQQTIRESIGDLCRRQAEHERRIGKMPQSREIERKWQEIARKHDRKSQDGK